MFAMYRKDKTNMFLTNQLPKLYTFKLLLGLMTIPWTYHSMFLFIFCFDNQYNVSHMKTVAKPTISKEQ